MKEQVSPAVMASIIVVAVVVVLGLGYMFFLKPKGQSMGSADRDKYMQRMQQGGMSGGSAGGTTSAGMSGGMMSGGMSGGMTSGGMSGGR